MDHVKLHCLFTILGDQSLDQWDTLLVGRYLGSQVVDVVSQTTSSTASRVLGGFFIEQFYHSLLIEFATTNKLLTPDRSTFLVQLSRVRRHATCTDTTNISMMGSWSSIEENVLSLLIKSWHQQSHIRKMSSSIWRMVRDDNITLLQLSFPNFCLASNACRHWAEMHRKMRSIGYKTTGCVEDSTREVESLFNVRANAGLL